MSYQQRNWVWITLTVLIILSIFIPNNSSWYFPVNLIILIAIYFTYFLLMRTRQYGFAILEAGLSAIWFDSYFKTPIATPRAISIFFGIIGVILMMIAIVYDLRKHREE